MFSRLSRCKKPLTHITLSLSSVFSFQLVLVSFLRGNGMSKVSEKVWVKKTHNLWNVIFCFQRKCVIFPLRTTITPCSGAGGNFWLMNCGVSYRNMPGHNGKYPEAKVYHHCHCKALFLDTSLDKSYSYTWRNAERSQLYLKAPGVTVWLF